MKILLADDHAVVRQGYRSLLGAMISPVTIIEAASGTDAGLLFHREDPDIAILDINMPDLSGIEVTRQILQSRPDARILIFSMYEEAPIIREALEAGALGYISKSSPPPVMLEAVRAVAQGERYLEPRFEQLLQRPAAVSGSLPAAADATLDNLPPREREIAERLLQGKNNQVIADELGISAKTVANRATVIRQKLGVGSTAEMVRKLLG